MVQGPLVGRNIGRGCRSGEVYGAGFCDGAGWSLVVFQISSTTSRSCACI